MILVEVNILNAIIAAIIAFIFGMLWHSPAVFGKQWMKLTGVTTKDMEKHKDKMMSSMVMNLIAGIVMAYVLSHILTAYQTIGWSEALQGAFWLWLGFIATTSLNPVLWEGKSWNLWLFNNAYQLISLIIMAIVLISL